MCLGLPIVAQVQQVTLRVGRLSPCSSNNTKKKKASSNQWIDSLGSINCNWSSSLQVRCEFYFLLKKKNQRKTGNVLRIQCKIATWLAKSILIAKRKEKKSCWNVGRASGNRRDADAAGCCTGTMNSRDRSIAPTNWRSSPTLVAVGHVHWTFLNPPTTLLLRQFFFWIFFFFFFKLNPDWFWSKKTHCFT